MAFKDILVHLAEPGAGNPALTAAASLAQRHDAHLTALHVYSLDWPLLMASNAYMDPATVQRIMDEGERAALEKAGSIQKDFEQVLRSENIRGEWRQVQGPVHESVTRHACYADIVVFGRPADGSMETRVAEAVLFASGRPILLMSPEPRSAFTAERILVGWNGSREAARAIGDAMPLLRMARSVQVLTAQSEDGAEAIVSAEDMSRHLARHGVPVSASTTTLSGVAAQDVLLDTASDFGADLLVIGGYGHGRLLEMVLGGVTRSMFRHATLPVLFSH